MLLQIDGWFGGGKSVLWTLLDGHPDVFCSPIHDFSFSAFLDQHDELDWVTTKHTEILRKILARTQYYKFEKVFLDGFVTLDFSSEDRLRIPVDYNFYNFDYNFIKSLCGMKSWSIEKIIDMLYYALYKDKSNNRNNKAQSLYFASMSNPLFIDHYKNIPDLFPNGKSIQVRRSVESILATRSNRKPMPEDFKTKVFYSDSLVKRIEQGEVEKIMSYYDKYDELEIEYPEKFFVVDFENITTQPEFIMNQVCSFLGINFIPAMKIASHSGKELICNGKKYIGEAHDTIDKLLSNEEIEMIENRKRRYHLSQSV